MENPRAKPIVGILGGVGSGKSTVAAEFGGLGCSVIDADKIAHELLEQSDVEREVVSTFGERILDSEGRIDRKKLGDVVFSDGGKLSALNKIIHPLVLAQAERLIEQYNQENQVKAIVLDMPLLMEVGWDQRCDKLVFVDCRREIRVDRAKKIGIMSKNQLRIRENFQISVDRKESIADNTVDNNSGFSGLGITGKWGLPRVALVSVTGF
ncbi:MAG: dephospho-CoA kinase [Planctomycetota bacterium]